MKFVLRALGDTILVLIPCVHAHVHALLCLHENVKHLFTRTTAEKPTRTSLVKMQIFYGRYNLRCPLENKKSLTQKV